MSYDPPISPQMEESVSSRLLKVPKVASRTRLRETTEAIASIVLDGVVPTGARLKEVELAAALGVSRATVREAVRQLVHEGVLVHEPYKGLRVATVDDQGWLDLSEVRAALEVVGAQRVARLLTPEMDAQLEAAFNQVRVVGAAGDIAAYHASHIALHTLVQHLSGNPVLEQSWAILETRMRIALRVDYETRPGLDRVGEHQHLLTAIRSGDPEVIARTINAHVIESALHQMSLRHERLGNAGGVAPQGERS